MPLPQRDRRACSCGPSSPEGYEGDSFAFSDEVMEKTDVFLTPGGIFGSEGNGYIRITLCCPEALLKKATEKIKAAFGK